MSRATFRESLAARKPLVMPAAHDALSARLIAQAGFPAMAISGSGLLAARYALPDLGIAGLADMAAATADIVAAAPGVACMGDGDDGYGDVKSMARTVRANEAMGVAALVVEDQSRDAKRPGQSAASAVVGDDEIAAKLRVAIRTRDSSDFWIFGRTDAYGALGIDAALRRAELYLRCGVDGLFVAGVRTEEHLRQIGAAFRGTPLNVVMYGGAGWPWLSVADLHAMGYTQIIYPLALMLPMCTLFADTLAALKTAHDGGGTPPLLADEQRARAVFAAGVEMERWLALERESR